MSIIVRTPPHNRSVTTQRQAMPPTGGDRNDIVETVGHVSLAGTAVPPSFDCTVAQQSEAVHGPGGNRDDLMQWPPRLVGVPPGPYRPVVEKCESVLIPEGDRGHSARGTSGSISHAVSISIRNASTRCSTASRRPTTLAQNGAASIGQRCNVGHRHAGASKGSCMRMAEVDFSSPVFTDHPPGWQTPSDLVAGFTLAWALELKERMRLSPYAPFAEGVRDRLPADYRFDTLGRLMQLWPGASGADFGRHPLARLTTL